MMAAAESLSPLITDFLLPLNIDLRKIVDLAVDLSHTYKRLAAESDNQFLPTPISDSILSPSVSEGGRYLAIDIGGTNLRVGFIELSRFGDEENDQVLSNGITEYSRLHTSRVTRTLEKSWPIGEQLKHEKAEDLFAWIGECIAVVVEDGVQMFGAELPNELPMGVTFSFPMIQHNLADATLMSMGKGFAITSNLDLGKQLKAGYSLAVAHRKVPNVKIVAILNDTIATLISFAYQLRTSPQRKAAMGLIVGTGNNATIPLKLSSLHPGKRLNRENIASTAAGALEDPKILINTEWSISGTAGPLRKLGMITKWDKILDDAGIAPGFQPFEYMTAGRYLGELGRLIIFDYLTTRLKVEQERLPPKICVVNGLTTSFLGNFGARQTHSEQVLLQELSNELPPRNCENSWQWTTEASHAVIQIAKAIQIRAAGMTAAAIIGLLACAEEFTLNPDNTIQRGYPHPQREELMVGFTGGCIVHFQNYLKDCQGFIDAIMETKFQGHPPLRVVLEPCHDGGIIGAGVLAATVQNLEKDR